MPTCDVYGDRDHTCIDAGMGYHAHIYGSGLGHSYSHGHVDLAWCAAWFSCVNL